MPQNEAQISAKNKKNWAKKPSPMVDPAQKVCGKPDARQWRRYQKVRINPCLLFTPLTTGYVKVR